MPSNAKIQPVPGHDGYFADSDGNIYSRRPGSSILKKLKPVRGSIGRRYLYVNLGASFRSGVHRIVASVFLPKPNTAAGERLVVRHKDNNPSNNALSNLEWGTQSQNLNDRYRHGTVPLGERNAASKIRHEDAVAIRARRAAGERCRDIASDFDIAHQTVWKIATGKTWKHVGTPLAPRQRKTTTAAKGLQ